MMEYHINGLITFLTLMGLYGLYILLSPREEDLKKRQIKEEYTNILLDSFSKIPFDKNDWEYKYGSYRLKDREGYEKKITTTASSF